MTKRTNLPLAVSGDTAYVQVRFSGIAPWVVIVDGLSAVYFGEDEPAYLTLLDAIRWHEKELAATNGRCGSRAFLEALKALQAKIEAGEVAEV